MRGQQHENKTEKTWADRLAAWIWPLVATASVGWSFVLLEGKLAAEVSTDPVVKAALNDGPFASDVQIIVQVIGEKLSVIPAQGYLLAVLSTLLAYLALAWYDRIGLQHLKRQRSVSLAFTSMCSFVAYALGHNIGASVVSGGAVRLRAYASQGLSKSEVATLIAFCSLTFGLGAAMLLGIVLIWSPMVVTPLVDLLPYGEMPSHLVRAAGGLLVAGCAAYAAGSFLRLKPLRIGTWRLRYPSPRVVIQQMVAGPLEILGAAAIIFFALPAEGNPGYLIVLGGFLISFCLGLLSQVPGGMGVMEAVFIALMPGIPASAVVAALLVWRIFYLLIPLALSGPIIVGFERRQLLR